MADTKHYGRYIVRSEDASAANERSFTCQTCAVDSIPVGQSRLLTDAWKGLTWRMWRQTETSGYALTVRLDGCHQVREVYGTQSTFVINPNAHTGHQPTSVERGGTDLVSELATVASVERYLREVRAS